ncbi:uncharacterized protein TRAVEDRAFT_46484 [Trametes versicolor FP-101664 SS1]|uniref:uncharacterized protein n=1 Tax=Trametes versicolor (strain FP-101664) TaxID=717944 RepID=UPI000462237E|nr:uncharacterized protein TRAVEDRAFT_46484 [Trametes versicolor FP-101664 SS1]EIW59177.1 hypothetical protein TRAVEDRAFT_46484 [Trametes versicolor FP-101664 SS1]
MATIPAVSAFCENFDRPVTKEYSYEYPPVFDDCPPTIEDSTPSCERCGIPPLILESGSTKWCECTLAATDRELVRLRAELISVSDRAATTDAQLDEAKEESRKKGQVIRRLQEQAVADQASLLGLEEKIQVDAQQHQDVLRRQSERFRVLEDRCSTAQQENGVLQETLRDVEAERDSRDASLVELKCATKDLDSRATFLERENASLSSEVTIYRDRCSSLSSQLEDATAAVDTVKTSYLNLQFQYDEDVARLTSEKRDKELDIIGLQKRLRQPTNTRLMVHKSTETAYIPPPLPLTPDTSLSVDISTSSSGGPQPQHVFVRAHPPQTTASRSHGDTAPTSSAFLEHAPIPPSVVLVPLKRPATPAGHSAPLAAQAQTTPTCQVQGLPLQDWVRLIAMALYMLAAAGLAVYYMPRMCMGGAGTGLPNDATALSALARTQVALCRWIAGRELFHWGPVDRSDAMRCVASFAFT